MFDDLVAAASVPGGGAGGWARVENAACARKLAAVADLLEARLAAKGSAEREQWCVDNWDAVCAEIAAALHVSLGVASHQLTLAQALRERLPRVAEAFSAGLVSARLIATIVFRTGLITDPQARATVDIELAGQIVGWGPLSVAKTELAIDELIERHDPYALRRLETRARGRHLDITPDAAGTAGVEGVLLGHDAAALDQRLDAMAATVCSGDPRTAQQRRADAMGALGRGQLQLECLCGSPDCPAADGDGASRSASLVVHVIAEADSLADDTPVLLDGQEPPRDQDAGPVREQTLTQILAQDAPTGVAATSPAVIVGGGVLPAPLLAAKVAGLATIRRVVHPGAAPPEPRYTPSQALADFIRCRDLTCRFPGCDEPACNCDLDHTIPYPWGPTSAANIKCLCRKNHLLKTFWGGPGGWRERQLPDGTIIWTASDGQTYTTHPGSRLLFPALCTPTAPVHPRQAHTTNIESANRGLKMPRRTRTRAQNRADRVTAQRARNRELGENPGKDCGDGDFPPRPRPSADNHPPPF
jgi:Domain of unknown function (DUF222)